MNKMAKIALLGNLRFNFGYPVSHHKWIEIQNDYFTNILYPILTTEFTKQNDIIIISGNTFENIHTLPPETIEHYITFLKHLSQIGEVHIINSTSDFNKTNNNSYSLNSMSELIDGVFINRTIKHIGDITLLPLQFTLKDLQANKPLVESKVLISNKKSKMLEHQLLNGYQMKFTTALPIESQNVSLITNLIQMNVNDQFQKTGFKIIDTESMNINFIENHRSPKYTTVTINTIEDIDAIEADLSKNHISLVISNDLIKGNRSAKRRIEILLNERKFNKVSHILSEVEEKVELPKTVIDPSTPFDTLIRDEIKNNTTINVELLLQEYDNVYRILKTKKE